MRYGPRQPLNRESNKLVSTTYSIITGNSGGPGANGGGILNAGTLTLLNSTLAGNSSPYGGGIFNVGPLTITNSTIAGNGGLREGGGIRTSSSRPVELQNT